MRHGRQEVHLPVCVRHCAQAVSLVNRVEQPDEQQREQRGGREQRDGRLEEIRDAYFLSEANRLRCPGMTNL